MLWRRRAFVREMSTDRARLPPFVSVRETLVVAESPVSPPVYTAVLESLAPAPSLVAPGRPSQTPQDLGEFLALAVRYPRIVAATMATAAGVLLASAATVVSLLGLPALVLAAPWALSLSLVATALFVARHARTRLGTGGVDADTERRILEVAVACRGRVTTTAVAHTLSMPLREADAALMALSRAGYLGIETHPASGALVYVFPEIDAGLVPSRVPAAGHPAAGCSPGTALVRSSLAERGLVRVSCKRRDTAALLAILGGSLGAHKFYLGEPLAGLVRFALFWTLLPALVGLCEGLGYLFMSDQAFDIKHNARLA
jgi:hypothetical protein